MNRFWEIVIQPILEITKSKSVVEIGAQQAINTRKLLPYVKEKGGVLHTIDPVPSFDYDEMVKESEGAFKFYKELSLSALPRINDYDAILIDGDHNWYTVFNELKIIEKQFKDSNQFPIIFAHDIGWPYGRRDLYYNPENIPGYFQQPYKKKGVSPDSTELVNHNGLNGHLFNAIYENNPGNGVLTAIEDFLEQANRDLCFEAVEGFHGLGIIYENTENNKQIKSFLETKELNDSLLKMLEGDRVKCQIKISSLQHKLAQQQNEVATKPVNNDDEGKIAELSNTIEKLNNELEELSKEKDVLAEQISNLDRLNREMNDELENFNNMQIEVKKSKQLSMKQIQDIKRKLEKESLKKKEVYNSVKYRLGDIIVSSFKSPKNFILLPYRLVKLISYAVKKKKNKSVNGKKVGDSTKIKKFYIEDYKDNVFYKSVNDILNTNKSNSFSKVFEESEKQIRLIKEKTDEKLKTEKPLVSIIMPTYNRANVMGQAIQSILEQSYSNWELLICDDASTDNTEKFVKRYKDNRIKYYRLKKGGAASARNHGLSVSKGDYIAYLDTDNVWHPEYLSLSIGTLVSKPGYYSIYSRYIDVIMQDNVYKLKTSRSLNFDYDKLSEKNYIDLNSYIHRRELYENLGGFSENLVRQQDWDLVLKYTFLREPLYLNQFLVLYRRNEDWNQITHLHKNNEHTYEVVQQNIDSYYQKGLPAVKPKDELPKVTIISWDVCRNHFSKAYNIAEALSTSYSVQLLGFRFFEEEIFPPYKNEVPNFEMTIIEGKNFPDYFELFSSALTKIKGDVIYAVKPRATSLGLALLANYHLGKPIVLEHNDLESVVTSPGKEKLKKDFELSKVDLNDDELKTPYSSIWSHIMEEFAHRVPVSTTHNVNLDKYFGGRSFYIRNLKDETYYNPEKYDRDKIREELGYSKEDRVILFGGLLRKHKGIFELVSLLDRLNDDRYKLLFVGSRETPDQKKLIEKYGDKIKVLPPQGRNDMSKINFASDLVILWLDPSIPASHYQMPYKFTDAIAMKVPVIASGISDLEVLANEGYLRIADYGDFEYLLREIHHVFDNKDETENMVEKARKLYIRQFSYKAVKSNLDIIFDVAKKHSYTLDVSKDFAEFFSKFYEHNKK